MQAPDFPTYLRKAMAAVRMGQADLARASGVGEAQISRWLRGQNQPDLPNLRRLARPLGRSLIELLVASGHLEPREAAMKDVPPPPAVPEIASVPVAIDADPVLEEEGKRALKQHYAGLVFFARQRREVLGTTVEKQPRSELTTGEIESAVRRGLPSGQTDGGDPSRSESGGSQVQGEETG